MRNKIPSREREREKKILIIIIIMVHRITNYNIRTSEINKWIYKKKKSFFRHGIKQKKQKKNINKTIKYDNNESTLIIATLRWRIRERLKERNKQTKNSESSKTIYVTEFLGNQKKTSCSCGIILYDPYEWMNEWSSLECHYLFWVANNNNNNNKREMLISSQRISNSINLDEKNGKFFFSPGYRKKRKPKSSTMFFFFGSKWINM